MVQASEVGCSFATRPGEAEIEIIVPLRSPSLLEFVGAAEKIVTTNALADKIPDHLVR